MEGISAENNAIYLDLTAENLSRALKTAQNARALKIKLTNKHFPCLTVSIELVSGGQRGAGPAGLPVAVNPDFAAAHGKLVGLPAGGMCAQTLAFHGSQAPSCVNGAALLPRAGTLSFPVPGPSPPRFRLRVPITGVVTSCTNHALCLFAPWEDFPTSPLTPSGDLLFSQHAHLSVLLPEASVAWLSSGHTPCRLS